MSCMLEFPSSTLPKNIVSPPYVLFGINDIDTFSDLPSNIPLALVLHFAPALRKWLLPPPQLSKSATQMALRTPFVGINIIADIEVEGLAWILARMMQIANVRLPVSNHMTFMFSPNLLVSIAIHKAWMALELPLKGIDALHVHIQTMLMIGPPVILFEMKGLWHNFPVGSDVLREMGHNFVRHYINKSYTSNECSAARHWYLETTERWSFFRALEKQFPAFDNVQKDTIKAMSDRKQKEFQMQTIKADVDRLSAKLSNGDRKSYTKPERQKGEREHRASRRRMERAKSTDSISSTSSADTVIWNPVNIEPSGSSTEATREPSSSNTEDPTTPTSESSEPLIPHSQPVDSSVLMEMLQEMAIKERFQQEDHKDKAKKERDLTPRASVFPNDMDALTQSSNETGNVQTGGFSRILELLSPNKKAQPVKTAPMNPCTLDSEEKYWDAEEDLDEMEYIPPNLANDTARLKLKHNLEPIDKSEMYKTRRFTSSAKALVHSELVEEAIAAANGALPLTSGVDGIDKGKKGSNSSLESIFHEQDTKPAVTNERTPTQRLFPVLTSSNHQMTTATNEHPTHEQVLTEMNNVNNRIQNGDGVNGDRWTDTQPLSGAILNRADGLEYLQPAVYQGPR